ncbi:MAG: transporter substrate-binding domain-containing protein, partial [Pseudomonadales bacterium]|nr:transporter substrate-binding domain-containing protein [Pseudomonadales bacterium]
ADELDLNYELELLDFEAKLGAIRDKNADVAIGCISVSEERERYMDFTHAVIANGFSAASLIEASLIPSFSDESLKMLLLLLLFVIFFSHLMWWSEHGQSAISDRYFPGVFQSIWFSLVTMSTVGYGDIAPQRWLGRISAALLIVTGVTAFGVIVGQFAADAIGQRAQKPVQS